MEQKQNAPLRLISDTGQVIFDQFTDIQKKFIFTKDYMTVDFAGLGSGKTSEMCAAIWLMMLALPGNRGWVCRQTLDKLEQSTMKEFFALAGLNAKSCRESPLIKHWNSMKRELVLKNGSEVKFVSFESEDSARGPNLGFYAVDQVEETTEQTFMDLDARCRMPSIPAQAWRSFVIGNPAPGWCKRTFKDRQGSIKNFTFYQSSTLDIAKIVGHEYLDRLLANRPKWWIDRFVYGRWGSREGQVFHAFSENNYISRWKFDKIFNVEWPVIAAYDHGSNSSHPCAILYMTWDKDNNFYVFQGAKKNLNVPEFSQVIKNLEGGFSGNNLLRRVADLDTFGQRGIGTPAEAYMAEGIGMVRCNKKPHYLMEAIAAMNTMFSSKKMFIVDDLQDVIDEFQGWEYKAKGDALDAIPANINDDYCKAMLYLLLEIQVEMGSDLRARSHVPETPMTNSQLFGHLQSQGINYDTGY
jgi:phage terminase large subunit